MIVCAASNNAGKLKELHRILERMGHEVKSLRELGIDLDPEEPGTTFAENARIKAEAFCKASGLPTIADDSGLCVDALGGAPGVEPVLNARVARGHERHQRVKQQLFQNHQQHEKADHRPDQFGDVDAQSVCLPCSGLLSRACRSAETRSAGRRSSAIRAGPWR